MEFLVRKFYSSGLKNQYENNQTNYYSLDQYTRNFNQHPTNLIQNYSTNSTRKNYNSFAHPEFNTSYDKIKSNKIQIIEEKIKELETKQNNKENISNILKIVKNNFFEKTKQKHRSNDTANVYISNDIQKKRKYKQEKFDNKNQKFYESDNQYDNIVDVQELNENIEDFKESLKHQLKIVQKKDEKGNIQEITNQIELYKKNYKKHIEDMKNQDLKEISILLEKLNDFKDDIQKEIDINSSKNYRNFSRLNEEISNFKIDYNEKINVLENKQKSDMDTINLFMERSSKIKKVIINESINSIKEFPKYIKPNRKELRDIISENKTNPRKDSLIKYDIQNLINKKEYLNKSLNEKILEKETTECLNINYSNSCLNSNSNMKKINKFRSYVYAIIANNIFLSFIKYNPLRLKKFISNYQKMDNLLNIWIYTSIKNTFMSIINFNEINLDINESNLSKYHSDTELRNKFMKIQMRINGLITGLSDNTNSDKLSIELRNYLLMLISEEKFIPYKFFCKFELKRLEFNNIGYLINLDKNKQIMILVTYIICKSLVDNILIHNRFTNQNPNNNHKKNFKVIGSVLYYYVINYFKTTVKTVSINNEYNNLENRSLQIKPKIRENKYYNDYNNNIKGKKIKIFDDEEKILLPIFNQNSCGKDLDNSENDMNFIKVNLIQENEFQRFLEFGNKSNYDLIPKIINWAEKLMDLIQR